ncbi:MAG: DUF2933 domain-containing protein [Burkholderiaceae bacterium]
MDHDRPGERPPSFWRSRFGIGWLALAGVAGWFLWTEHRAHLFGMLPYLVLLACPLMHVFMHRRHRHESHDGHIGGPSSSVPPGRASGDAAPGERS